MSQPSGEFDANEFPEPELNPLLNPLLAANMRRWAAVYFTTPPEKRGPAIYELLRELEGESAAEPASAPEIDSARNENAKMEEGQESSSAEPVLTCRACAHSNAAGQRFCGMCGAPLPALSEVSEPQAVDALRADEVRLNEPESSSHHTTLFDYATYRAPHRETDDASERAQPLPQNDFPSFAVEPESRPYAYRLYAGVALAILLGVLVYMAWRGTGTLSDGAARPPALSKAVSAEQQQAAISAPQPAAKGSAPVSMAARSSVPAPVTPDQPPASARSAHQEHPAARPADRGMRASAPSREVVPGEGGAEELAMAEKYLNGKSGAVRDSREAAQWLWKAVGKGNIAATVELSDLYLRGDGVPKSCDQGRLLLDAAARKGGTAAAVRLRNLQAFGCQ